MAGQNSIAIDTAFLADFSHLKDELAKAVRRALSATNRWLRHTTMLELGFELSIDHKALKKRFRVYGSGRMTKLWVGVREIGVHRLGHPQQTQDGVKVGSHYYPHAFINPMNSDRLLVWRRKTRVRSSLELVKMDIADESQAIIKRYEPRINRKFKEMFHREFRYVLSGTR